MKIKSNILLPAFALMASAVVATAQDNNNQRGNFNPEEFRARMEERVKTSLKVTDDEWKVLQPLIEKVQTAQRESFSGRFGGFGGRGGPGGRPGGDGAAAGAGAPATGAAATGGGGRQRGGSEESQALRTALESDSSTPEDIKAKLAALRASRKKAEADLAAARAELQKVVTVRQEAVLVSMGMLE